MNTFPSFKLQIPSRPVRRVLLAALLAVGAATAMSAWSQPVGHHGPGHGMGGAGEMFQGSPERLDRMIDHLLDGLNTTEAQRIQIKQIVQAAAADLKAQREGSAALRGKAVQIMTAPSIDAASAEVVRQQMLAQHDQTSRRVMQAMLDVGQVLSAEQRAKLGERYKQREARRIERSKRM